MSEQPNNETPATAETAQAQLKNVPRVSKLIETQKSTLILMFFILLVGISIIMWAWQIGPFNTPIQQTDNSYIKGKTTVLSSQINGYIQDVLVSDFDHVKKGQTLLIIEAMKVMNEITSDVDGEIVEINVSNEEMVEYNQVLFTVKEG